MGFYTADFESGSDILVDNDVVEISPRSDFNLLQKGLDSIGMFNRGHIPGNYDDRAISFTYILETGFIPSVTSANGREVWFAENRNDDWGSQVIDWNKEDHFNLAIDTVEVNTLERIARSDTLQSLLNQQNWTKEDRVAWESGISQIVNEETDKIRGLGEYRITTNTDGNPTATRRALWVNELSSDIRDGTHLIEFDCETMSIFEGSVLQRVENQLLPEANTANNFRQAATYFYVDARANFNWKDPDFGGHAFIMSSLTGNIIEATAQPDKNHFPPYRESVDPDWSFEKFLVDGAPFLSTTGAIYAADHIDSEELMQIRLANGDLFGPEQIFGHVDPTWADDPTIPENIRELATIKQTIEGYAEFGMGKSLTFGGSAALRAIYREEDRFYRNVLDHVENGTIHEITDFLKQNSAYSEPRFENSPDHFGTFSFNPGLS